MDEAQSLLEEDAKRADMREGQAIHLPILYFCVAFVRLLIFWFWSFSSCSHQSRVSSQVEQSPSKEGSKSMWGFKTGEGPLLLNSIGGALLVFINLLRFKGVAAIIISAHRQGNAMGKGVFFKIYFQAIKPHQWQNERGSKAWMLWLES